MVFKDLAFRKILKKNHQSNSNCHDVLPQFFSRNEGPFAPVVTYARPQLLAFFKIVSVGENNFAEGHDPLTLGCKSSAFSPNP